MMSVRKIGSFSMQWPAVSVMIAGQIHTADQDHFEDDDLIMDVGLEEKNGVWIKSLSVTAKHPLPTPDYVEMDRQTVSDPELRLCGYVDLTSRAKSRRSSEESAGTIFGCGYPLIGRSLFVGLEHQAGFARIEEQNDRTTTYSLRHHPVWEGDRLESMTAVLGIAENPYDAFWDYLEKIRIPIPLKPFFAFCSFWSDPYLGNYEYAVTGEAMQQFIAAYHRLGFSPDAFTFDAGWQNRRTFFQPKPGLEFDRYPDLSLWVSYNGPMGIDPDYLKAEGYAVGEGLSSAYSGEGYAVLMDRSYEQKITECFCRLAAHNRLFKIDWDNDCATAPEFNEKYPTRDHVREASINAMNRILAAVRKVNPEILIRSGWWPSPWWLQHCTHVFLSQSGDSEYACLPALHQRASAATHRDLMYYNHLRRDRTMMPLNSFDNHEFPNSIRNAFIDTDSGWTDNLMLCLLRGSTYFSWTVQPESLTAFQTAAMKQAMAFAREQAEHLFVRRGQMIGGHPGRGEVYGFLQNGSDESWCVLRNPSCMPASFPLPENAGHAVQIYPDFRRLEGEILLLPEEVKVLIFSGQEKKLPYDIPFQAVRSHGKCEYRFPASLTVSPEVQPMVAPLHRIDGLSISECSWHQDGTGCSWTLLAPYRMKDLRMVARIRTARPEALQIRSYVSRYPVTSAEGSAFALPVTEINPSHPGYGEIKNIEKMPEIRERYFSFPVPANGSMSYCMTFGTTLAPDDLELWCVGYEDTSAECIASDLSPLDFSKMLPLQHPLGFPSAVRLRWGSARALRARA